jgi:hypothetical protein
LLHALRPAVHTWIEEHVASDAPRRGTAVAVEDGYIADSVRGGNGFGGNEKVRPFGRREARDMVKVAAAAALIVAAFALGLQLNSSGQDRAGQYQVITKEGGILSDSTLALAT